MVDRLRNLQEEKMIVRGKRRVTMQEEGVGQADGQKVIFACIESVRAKKKPSNFSEIQQHAVTTLSLRLEQK